MQSARLALEAVGLRGLLLDRVSRLVNRLTHFSLCGFACLANVRLPLIDSLLVHALKINGKNEQLYCNDKQYMICLSSQSQSDKIGIRHEDLYVQC